MLCLASIVACAQEVSASPAPAACLPESKGQTHLQCLNETAVFADMALQRSLKKFNELLQPKQGDQLQAQQHEWMQRRDKECTPTDRPAADSNALAHAALCRSKMSLQRTDLLESMLLAVQPLQGSAERICRKGEKAGLDCLSQQRDMIETGMRRLYAALLLNLPELQADSFYTEQKVWEALREKSCQLNGYVHEKEDQIVCHIRMALERVKDYRKNWQPQTRKESQP